MNRRRWLQETATTSMTLGLGSLALLSPNFVGGPSLLTAEEAEESDYRSPYHLKLRHSKEQLEQGFHEHPWNDSRDESFVPAHAWYDRHTERRWGAWGPPARQYPAAPGLEHRSTEWMQDRVIHSAARWLGLPYQHHHIPAWDPPAHWPWLKVAYGRNSRGIDCSNFSSFYYNYGLGIKLDTGIRQQAERRDVRGPGGHGVLQLHRIEPMPFEELVDHLQPADLLYIKNDAGRVGHVIMWLGEVGVSPDGAPLVIDSTGLGHKDSSGVAIPIGVHIRPFTENSWYFRSFSHAHRIIPAIPHLRDGEAPEPEEGGAHEA